MPLVGMLGMLLIGPLQALPSPANRLSQPSPRLADLIPSNNPGGIAAIESIGKLRNQKRPHMDAERWDDETKGPKFRLSRTSDSRLSESIDGRCNNIDYSSPTVRE